MATEPFGNAIEQLRRGRPERDFQRLTDAQLLERFLSHGDEAALTALVRRHAPMVWGVCRRVLRSEHDAEDAFQATFLVLIRRAASIATRELVANWLYRVAYNTALRARATAARRHSRERTVPVMPEPHIADGNGASDLRHLLDRELSRMPEKYRVPIILCDLEGKTREEAAAEIGCPEGTVAGRLARARDMLAKRIVRSGVLLSVAALAAELAREGAAAVPAALLSTTHATASLGATAISPAAAALGEGVAKTIRWARILRRAAAALVIVLVVGAAIVGVIYFGGSRNPAQNIVDGRIAPVAPQLDNWQIAVRTSVVNGQVEFDLFYGRGVTGIYHFVVTDEKRENLWIVHGAGQARFNKITYGVVPVDPTYLGPRQTFPESNKPPKDIRGTKIHLRVDYRDTNWFGTGTEIYEDDIEVPMK
jgi:RNA polymerase sigma factor (sigma-70 family)